MNSRTPSSSRAGSFLRILAILAILAPGELFAGMPPRPVFDCRVPLAPIMAKLLAAGGDPSRVLTIGRVADLTQLTSGARYKFSLTAKGRFAVAPQPAKAPGNAYSHPILSGGEPVLTAGGIRVEHDGATMLKVTVDQDSQSYCPTADSLQAALDSLASSGVPAAVLRVENRPPECPEPNPNSWPPTWPRSATAPPAPPRYGSLMVEVGRRFETFGRAIEARRYELAAHELDELIRVFRDDLPSAAPPRMTATIDLAAAAASFVTTVRPALEGALSHRNPVELQAAFADAAELCNKCHRATGHDAIVVPATPGKSVPEMTPLTH